MPTRQPSHAGVRDVPVNTCHDGNVLPAFHVGAQIPLGSPMLVCAPSKSTTPMTKPMQIPSSKRPTIRVARRFGSIDVIEMLAELCLDHGVPDLVRSDQGPEFIAIAVREWIAAVGAKTAFIERASPWENGYVENFNGKLRDELLNAEIFYSLAEVRIMIETWRRHYNTVRPHSALAYRPLAPCVVQWPAAPDSSPVAPPATAPLAPNTPLH
jgi:putative transposase